MPASAQAGYSRKSFERLLFHYGNVHTARVVSENQIMEL